MIKPMSGASYKHTIDALDEMLINQVKRYSIMRADAPVDTMVMKLIGAEVPLK